MLRDGSGGVSATQSGFVHEKSFCFSGSIYVSMFLFRARNKRVQLERAVFLSIQAFRDTCKVRASFCFVGVRTTNARPGYCKAAEALLIDSAALVCFLVACLEILKADGGGAGRGGVIVHGNSRCTYTCTGGGDNLLHMRLLKKS